MFSATEFQTRVKDGAIEIPQEYRQDLGDGSAVRVIVLKQIKKISKTGIIAELTENPIKVRGVRNLTRDEIYKL